MQNPNPTCLLLNNITPCLQVLLNSPEESPVTSHAALRVPMRRDFQIILTPHTIKTFPDLLSTTSSQRGCLFQSEETLDFFSFHTQNNCILECLLKAALSKCRCVPFYIPRESCTYILVIRYQRI